ncbi:MAG: HAD hydrolase family protein [Gammaproteobacteria bacterium]|nr:HAD hydrolase family protein [Gammaproteobacteria bacterium]
MQAELEQRLKQIKLVVFDVDGVFTDGRISLNPAGEESKTFHIRDGHGVRLLIHYGVEAAVLSGRKSNAVSIRMRELGMQDADILQGHIDKLSVFDDLLARKQLTADQVAYIGDDIVDLGPIRKSAVGFAVNDAHPMVCKHADYVTQEKGGHGAVREICELILAAQDRLNEALEFNL